LLFAIGSGLRCRGEKHDPVPDLLTSSAFVGTTSEKPANFCNARQNEAAGTADAAAWVIAGVCDFALR